MYAVRSSHGPALYSPLLRIVRLNQRSSFSSTCLRPAPKPSRHVEASMLNVEGPLAEKLSATKVWLGRGERYKAARERRNPDGTDATADTTTTPAKRKRSTKSRHDASRVNIVSEKLCDDIFSYLGPTLERHRGCDILEIYPGAGLWGRKLNDFLQPRSHILMEPDSELYRPFLKPLLDRPGTVMVPQSGIIWRELEEILSPRYFPHQVIPEKEEDRVRRNDTLLVTANLVFHPKKRFGGFDSLSTLVLHQFVNAIRSGRLFHRYGLVRMLVWAREDDLLGFLPKTISRRRRQAIDNDLLCEWVHEVAGTGQPSAWYVREDALNSASILATMERMKAANLHFPPGRESTEFAQVLAGLKEGKPFPVPGRDIPIWKRPYKEALASLQAADEDGAADDDDAKQIALYRWRSHADANKAERILRISQALDSVVALRKADSPKFQAALAKFLKDTGEASATMMDEFITYKDNLHAFRRDTPLLQWDRRAHEPLTIQPQETYPNIPCCLVDIQPKAPHPLLRQSGPQSNRASDIFDVMTGMLMMNATQSIGTLLDALAHGSADHILSQWANYDKGPDSDFYNIKFAEPSPRLMGAQHWEEVLQLWMDWPFRPEFTEMVARAHDEVDDRFDDLTLSPFDS
ncbi:hypothetical protein GGR50DRAFT_646055 [Xylaria sp. CBS 124048]|nr:hypothetical protein GGR50DRAFT_646055 [Xylaria sp. CBS 124048]